jgi:hypothetical protein
MASWTSKEEEGTLSILPIAKWNRYLQICFWKCPSAENMLIAYEAFTAISGKQCHQERRTMSIAIEGIRIIRR